MPDRARVIRQAFKTIDDEELEALSQVARVCVYPPGTVLIREGELEHVFYIVAEGQVAITHRMSDEEQRLIAVRKSGEFFGEMALIDNKPRTASATTLTETRVLEISEHVFNDFLSRSPNLALAMIRHISSNLRAADQASIAELSRINQELARAYDDLKAAQAELVAKERMERELEIAGEVQRSLLPDSFPFAPGYSFAGRNVPARHVGGDLFDVIGIDDAHVGVLMADVSDKSVHAALIMAVTRTLFLAHARRSLSPAEVALAVHEGFLEVSSNDEMFVTVFYGVLDLASGDMCYIRGGQDRPLLLRADGQPPIELDAAGRFLGMMPGLMLEERVVNIAPGDLFVAYSDGVPDAVNSAMEDYGLERLFELLERHRRSPAHEVCSAIFNDVFHFRGAAPAHDDITVLVVRRSAVEG
jgi:phosphoserine phosphatase RsbU/P